VNSFSEIRITEGTVILRDEPRSLFEALTDVEFALAWPSISKSFAATGRLTWRDEVIDAGFSLTDFVAALTGDRSGLKARIAGAPLKLAFDGYVSHRPTLRMEGMLAADTASLRDALRWATDWAIPSGGFGRFALKAQTNVVGSTIALSGVNIELDGNVGEGVLTLTGDGRKTLQGTLAADALDLTPTFRARACSPAAIKAGTGADRARRPQRRRSRSAPLRRARQHGQCQARAHAVAANMRSGSLTLAIGESRCLPARWRAQSGLPNRQPGRPQSAAVRRRRPRPVPRRDARRPARRRQRQYQRRVRQFGGERLRPRPRRDR
jgi:AsmA protein